MQLGRVETERRHSTLCLALVEPVAFEILEQVAREAQLGRAHGAAARKLEAERRLPVVEDEPVVLAERLTVARGLEHGVAERELERVRERRTAAAVALRERPPALVDERERAAEVAADDREQRLEAAPGEDGVGEALVHLQGAREALELLVRKTRPGRLRDRDERDLVGDADDREAELVRLLDERGRGFREPEAEPEAEPREPVVREAAQVRPLRRGELADPEAGREQELAALEERRRVLELRDVEPCDLVREALRARRDREAEPVELDDLDRRSALGHRGQRYALRPRFKAHAWPARPDGRRRFGREVSCPGDPAVRSVRRGLAGGGRQRPRARGAGPLRRARRRDAHARRRSGRGGAGLGRRRARVRRLRRGLGCQNTGHGLPAAVAAIHEQVDRYLHQCFMVGMYEPYVEVCRRLAELSPCAGEEQRSLLVNSGAEAIENAVKIARAATGRPAVVVFDHAFHGRTLLTMTMTSKVAYKRGFGPFAPEVYRAPAPYPYRGIGTADALAGLELLFASEVDPASVACVVLEPVQGEGGFIVMPDDFPRALKALCERHGILYVDDEVQTGVGRTGPVWAIEHYGVEPDLLVSGKSLGGGLPLAGVTGRAGRDGRAGARRPSGGRSAATPRRARPRARSSTRSRRRRSGPARTSSPRCVRGSTRSPERVPQIGDESAGSARCSRSSSSRIAESKAPAGPLAKATVERALAG